MKPGISVQAGSDSCEGVDSFLPQSPRTPLLVVSSSSSDLQFVPAPLPVLQGSGPRRENLGSATRLRPPHCSTAPLPPFLKPGVRGSKIPISRSNNKVSSGWCAAPISRSLSLTTLPGNDPDDCVLPGRHSNHTFSTSHTKQSIHLSVSSQNLAGSISSAVSSTSPKKLVDSTVKRSSESRRSQVTKGKQGQRHRQPSRSPFRNASLVVCKSSPCARLGSTLAQDYDPYETPHYYTFHLTLRSPANVPRRGRSHTTNSCLSSNDRTLEPGRGKTCSGIGLRSPKEDCNSMNKSEGNAADDRTQDNTAYDRDVDIDASGGGMPNEVPESHDISQSISAVESFEDTDGEVAPEPWMQRLEARQPSAKVKCICFGIVDYLNTVLKEVEQDAFWESWCGDYGPVLTSVPPTGISDSESSIEPLAVSLSLPLNYPSGGSCDGSGGGGTPTRKNKSFRLLRWKSCHDLLPHRRPWTLKRQLTDHSFAGRSSAGLVEVYDGNLGISVVPVSISNCNPLTSTLCGNTSSKNVSAEMGKICLKGPASSPPSLTHYGKNDVRSTTPGKFDNDKIWMGCNDERRVCLVDRPSASRVGETVKPARKNSGKAVQVPQKDSAGKQAKQEDLLVEMDCALGIQEDDGSGPGLSEDEAPEEWLVDAREGSANKPLWMPAKECYHRSTNEMSIRRLHPLLSDAGKTASKAVLIAPPDYRLRSSSDDSRGRRHFSGASRQSSTRSRLSHMYSPSSQGNSSAEDDSDTGGAELSELERRVLSLSHRRSQLRKQDTNACLIAPPEFKIAENFSGYPGGSHGMPL